MSGDLKEETARSTYDPVQYVVLPRGMTLFKRKPRMKHTTDNRRSKKAVCCSNEILRSVSCYLAWATARG